MEPTSTVQPLIGNFIGIRTSGSDDFDVSISIFKHLKPFGENGVDIWLTQTVVTTWVIMGVLILLAVIFRFKLKNYKQTPEGSQNIVELLVESMDSLTRANMGDKDAYFGNWFFGVFLFILFSNLSGLLGFRPPTADICTTLTLALTTFILIHFMGMFTGKGSYFKSYFEPVFFLFPINVVSELSTPISLSFRLFGNIFGGLTIMALVYSLPRFLNFGLPAVLHIYFDLFAGCIQTVIFVMLSMIFIKDKIAD